MHVYSIKKESYIYSTKHYGVTKKEIVLEKFII